MIDGNDERFSWDDWYAEITTNRNETLDDINTLADDLERDIINLQLRPIDGVAFDAQPCAASAR